MLRRFRLLIIVFCAVSALYSCKNKAKEIPINDFFKTPEKSGFKISPDGKYISYIKTDTGRKKQKQNLYIVPIEDIINKTGKEHLAASFNDISGRDYSWTYDNQIVFIQNIFNRDDPKTDTNKLVVLDVATLKLRDMLVENHVRIRVLNRNRQEPDIITIEMNKRDSLFNDIYRLNIKTGELKTYLVNTAKITETYPDAEGKILLAKISDGVDETILYRPKENAPFKAIIKNNFKESVIPIAFTTTKNAFYALSNVNRDKTALVTINPETGKEEQVVFATESADILTPRYSTNKHRLDFVSWEEAKPKKHFLNGVTEHVYKTLLKHNEVAGSEVNIMSTDSAEDKFIVNTYTDRDPGSVYLYQSKIDKLSLLVDNSDIQPEQLCSMRPISYKAGDGTTINGYLTLPQGDSTNLPVVVMPHDGLVVPFNRDLWRYNADVQFLANRGYAVFQVNYRGSIGYGKAFYKAGFKQAGGKIQEDITDGVNWLITNKIANPKKIAIFGSGFGGFSALYGLMFHQNLYSCAIVQNPLINFYTYVKDVPPFLKPSLQMMYERVGDPANEKDADRFQAISPSFHPDRVKAPLLIFPARGGRANANLNDLNQFVRELKKRGVTVDYQLRKDNNERGQSRGKYRVDTYTEIIKFLDNHMQVKR
jgi:dipeptidyl aminopeptidase/acylaminoacyl peptidase